jgi:hypothetical protein
VVRIALRARLGAWLVVAVAGAAVLASLAGTAYAGGRAVADGKKAPPPSWKQVTVYKVDSEVVGVAALSSGDAWEAGTECGSPCDETTLLVGHWNGKTWDLVSPPPEFLNDEEEASAAAVAPVSASVAWVFADQNVVTNHSFALLRSGSSWGVTELATGTSITTAVAPNAKDAWAFGENVGSFSPYVVHYNGKSWSAVSLGVVGTDASALSASNVWVIGNAPTVPKSRLRVVIEHYNGKVWQKAVLPKVSLPAGEVLDGSAIDAAGTDNVWATAVPVSPTTDGTLQGILALHYNGKSWAEVKVPYPVISVYGPFLVASDGKSGFWLAADQDVSGAYRPYLYHDSGKSWTRVAAPAGHGDATELLSMAWIPGTTTLWGAGHELPFPTDPFGTEQGVLLKYGP